tara:strand:+ start:4791 stop:5471 length:681 start_codon:yes stop_codon:yes gene_type:complete
MFKLENIEIAFIVTAFNEEKTISKVVNDCINFGDVFVINDCSADNTLQQIKRLNVKYINNSKNLGYEKSLFKCLNYAHSYSNYNYFITIDGDRQFNLNSIKLAIEEINENKLFISSIRNNKNRWIEIFIDKLFYFLFKINDPLSGLKIYSRKIIDQSNNVNLNGLLGMNIILFCIIKKIKIHQFKIDINPREGNSTFGGIFKSNTYIIISLLKFFYKYILFKNNNI